ncbi:MAG: hypothetical protein M3O36_07975 [Myxococcota bacterium]|nr:hypothetical protein [Myxococcota bacterium]
MDTSFTRVVHEATLDEASVPHAGLAKKAESDTFLSRGHRGIASFGALLAAGARAQ